MSPRSITFVAIAALPAWCVAQDCVAPPPNLIACWDADGLLAYAQPRDPDAFHPATRPGLWCDNAVSGKVGNAFGFAINNFLLPPSAPLPEFNVPTPISVELWVRIDAHANANSIPLTRKDGTAGSGFGLYLDGVTGQARLDIGSGVVTTAVGGPDLRDGLFHHVAGTFDATDGLHVYVDGAPVATTPSAGPMLANAGWLAIGDAWNFTGRIDEVSLYNRALTHAEIAALAAADDGKCKEPWPQRVMTWGVARANCTMPSNCATLTGHTISIQATPGGDRMVAGSYNGLRVYERSASGWTESAEIAYASGTPWNGLSAAIAGNVIGACAPWPVPGNVSVSFASFYSFDGLNWVGPTTDGTQRGTRFVAADGDTFVMLGRESTSLQYEFRIWRTGGAAPTVEYSELGLYSTASISGDLLALGNWTALGATGEVRVYQRSGTSWSLLHVISPDGYETVLPTAGLHFGWSVALDGERLLVTAAAEGAVNQPGGVAYVFDLSSGAVQLEPGGRLTPSRPARRFGMSGAYLPSLELGSIGWVIGTGCALRGDLAVVGAPTDRESGWNPDSRGNTLAFAKKNGVWGEAAKLHVGGLYEGSLAGMAVGITSDHQVVVGVPDEPNGTAGGGVAWFDDFQHAHLPTSYCTSSTTTNGCSPAMSSLGTPSLSNQHGFYLRTSQVEGQKQGLIFYGINGRRAGVWAPGSTSVQCVKGPAQRTGTLDSEGTPGLCDGSFSIEWNTYLATHPGAIGQPMAVGALIDAQAWFRDPAAPKGMNFSNGLEFMVLP